MVPRGLPGGVSAFPSIFKTMPEGAGGQGAGVVQNAAGAVQGVDKRVLAGEFPRGRGFGRGLAGRSVH